MTCKKIKRNIPKFLNDDLREPDRRLFAEHLNTCPECPPTLRQYQSSWNLLKDWKDVDPEPGYLPRFWVEVAQRKTWRERIQSGVEKFFPRKIRVPVAAGLCTVWILSVVLWNRHLEVERVEARLQQLNPQEAETVENVEFAGSIDVLENLDILEEWEFLQEWDGNAIHS